ncbi:putative dihydroorotate dehydrogenase [Cryptosporidium felis]|nr:putative dihydroorotate dehydrogenase [Cryptosporidium felis]
MNFRNKENLIKNTLENFESDDKVHSMLFGRLTAEQREAVQINSESSLLIVAGPGTGKTATITARIIHFLLKGYSPILALTFTRKAANELRNRISTIYLSSRKNFDKKKQTSSPRQRIMNFLSTPEIFIGTIHSFCWKLLREYGSFVGLPKNISIIDKELSLKILRSCTQEVLSRGISSQISSITLNIDPNASDDIERDDLDEDSDDENCIDGIPNVEMKNKQFKQINNQFSCSKDSDLASNKGELEKLLKIIKIIKVKEYVKNGCTLDEYSNYSKKRWL